MSPSRGSIAYGLLFGMGWFAGAFLTPLGWWWLLGVPIGAATAFTADRIERA